MPAALASLLIAVLTLVPSLLQEGDVIKKEFTVSPGGTLYVDLDRGNMYVEVVRSDRVQITMERDAKAENKDAERAMLKNHEYSFDKRSNDVHIRSRFRHQRRPLQWRGRNPVKIKLTVGVPSEYSVEFHNGSGNIEVEDVTGRVEGRTGAGNIVLSDITGIVDIKSGAGNVEVEGEIERASIHTGAGNIEVRGPLGSADINSGAGNIDTEIIAQPSGDTRFRTGAGNVVVTLDEDVSVRVEAKTALGSAHCEFPLEVSKSFLSKSFSGEINGGDAVLEMHAGVGNVTLKRR